MTDCVQDSQGNYYVSEYGEWDRIQKGQGIPDDTPESSVGAEPIKPAPLLVKAGLASSNSEAMRKLKEGAVEIEGAKVTDYQREVVITAITVIRLEAARSRICSSRSNFMAT